jgi:sulfate/thiosulfate transport system ATP-binding protein
MLRVESVEVRYGDTVALDGVDLDVGDGEVVSVLGPSGSGKSTLLRVIAGLETPDAGDVTIGGVAATALPPQRRDVGFVFQHYAAFKHMTVRDNIGFGLRIRKRPKPEIARRVNELLALVQLDGFGDRYPSQLSGGQRQRMALARALAVEPRVLLLDEPFGALDARVREELREWLRRLHEQVHVTTVLVTHDQAEAMDVASRIVVMNHGRIEQVGTPADIYERPATEFVMTFVGKVNRLPDRFIRPHDIVIRAPGAPGCAPATVGQIRSLGFDAWVELHLDSGETLWAQLTRAERDRLALAPGMPVGADLTQPVRLAAVESRAVPELARAG